MTLALVLLFAAMAAWALSEYAFRGRLLLGAFFALGIMVPIRLGTVSILELMVDLNLTNTLTALILVYTAQGLPLAIFILGEFISQVPRDLKDAARCDGVGEIAIFFAIIVPLIRPAIATVAIFVMVPIWNDLWFPLILSARRRQADHHARCAAICRPVCYRLERGTGVPDPGHRAGSGALSDFLAPTGARPDRGCGEIVMSDLRIENLSKSFGATAGAPIDVTRNRRRRLHRHRRTVGLRQVHIVAGHCRTGTAGRGSIAIGGRDVNELAPAERRIAMVFQSYALYPHMDVYKNMAFGLKFAGLDTKEIEPASTGRPRCCSLRPS